MGKIKRDSDPKNDYDDGRSSLVRAVARAKGWTVTKVRQWLKGK